MSCEYVYPLEVDPSNCTTSFSAVALVPWYTLKPARSVSALPSVFCMGADHDSVALPVTGAGALTVMPNAGNDVLAVPSLTDMAIPEYVPAWEDEGVPDSDPVAVLKIAQAGLFDTLKASMLPSESLAVGVNV